MATLRDQVPGRMGQSGNIFAHQAVPVGKDTMVAEHSRGGGGVMPRGSSSHPLKKEVKMCKTLGDVLGVGSLEHAERQAEPSVRDKWVAQPSLWGEVFLQTQP